MDVDSLTRRDLDLRRLDLTSDAEVSAAHDIVEAAMGHERPHASRTDLAEHAAEWRYEDPAIRLDIWGAWRDSQLVGVGMVNYPLLDNQWVCWGGVFVAPEQRGQGVGGALVEHLSVESAAFGRTAFHAGVEIPPQALEDHPSMRFAAKHGFTTAWIQVNRRLALPFGAAVLDSLARDAAEHFAPDYTLETYVGGVAEHRQASLCEAMNRLVVDAPSGDVEFEEASETPALYRSYVELEHSQGRERVTTLAIHTETGVVAAYTDVVLPSGSPTHAWQYGTLVRGDHRGRRLGMAVKVENIRHIQQHFPEREQITTGNAETNEWMVAINERLGFEVFELNPALHRQLV